MRAQILQLGPNHAIADLVSSQHEVRLSPSTPHRPRFIHFSRFIHFFRFIHFCSQVVVSTRTRDEDVLAAIEAAGYTPQLLRATDQYIAGAPAAAATAVSINKNVDEAHISEADLLIGGMTCTACAGAVEAALFNVSGVRAASVSMMTCNGRVEYDDRLTSVPAMIDAVVAAGYSAEPIAADAQHKGPDHAREARS